MKIPMNGNGNHHSSSNTVATHRQAEKELRETRDALKLRIREITAKLAKANEKLKVAIAARKRVEHAILQREIRMRSVVDGSSGIVFLKDPNEQVAYVNPRFRKALPPAWQQISASAPGIQADGIDADSRTVSNSTAGRSRISNLDKRAR